MFAIANTIGKVNLNDIKFGKKVTFNTTNNGKEDLKIIKKQKEKEENKFLNKDEQKNLFIHLNEDISDYVSYEMIFQLILNASQKFEGHTYSKKIFNVRRQLWLHFMPLIDNMTSTMFNKNKKQYENYCVTQFEKQLN